MLDDLTDYLATNNFGTVGQSLFEYYYPDKGDTLYFLNQTGGVVGEDAKYLPISNPTIQIVTRDTRPNTAKDRAEAISLFLHNIRNTQMGSTFFYYILKLQDPAAIGKDSSGRYEWTQNFLALIR